MIGAPDCGTCTHPGEAHDAGECWWDLRADLESWDPVEQCPCGWYKPAILGAFGGSVA